MTEYKEIVEAVANIINGGVCPKDCPNTVAEVKDCSTCKAHLILSTHVGSLGVEVVDESASLESAKKHGYRKVVSE